MRAPLKNHLEISHIAAKYANKHRTPYISLQNTVVELIGGIDPSLDYVSAALSRGKNVVTANKALLSAHYDMLIDIAEKNHAVLRCAAAAGGGIPWLRCLSRTAACDEVTAVSGIMNGTTNYILSAMTQSGEDYAGCLLKAQKLGYAEADPTADVEGLDARRKLVLSANIAFGISLREEDVPCFGISGITAKDIAEFGKEGKVCKLIAHAENRNGRFSACVEPMLFSKDMQMSRVSDADNLICLDAQRVGRQSFFGAGAGGYPTAANVLADCLEIIPGCSAFYTNKRRKAYVENTAARQLYYIRCGEQAQITELSIGEAHVLAAEYKKQNRQFFMAAVAEGDRDKC